MVVLIVNLGIDVQDNYIPFFNVYILLKGTQKNLFFNYPDLFNCFNFLCQNNRVLSMKSYIDINYFNVVLLDGIDYTYVFKIIKNYSN